MTQKMSPSKRKHAKRKEAWKTREVLSKGRPIEAIIDDINKRIN